MKKIGIVMLTLAIVFVSITQVNNLGKVDADEKNPIQTAQMIGETIRGSIFNDSEKSAKFNNTTLDSANDQRVIGVILGEEIAAEDIAVKTILFELSGSDNPLQDAWSNLKLEIYEKQFAEEHGLTPSDEEIIAFTQNMRKTLESAPGGKEYAKALLEAAGMTEEEYWEEYKVKYESPQHLTKSKIGQYLTENQLPLFDEVEIINNIDSEITDQELIRKYAQ